MIWPMIWPMILPMILPMIWPMIVTKNGVYEADIKHPGLLDKPAPLQWFVLPPPGSKWLFLRFDDLLYCPQTLFTQMFPHIFHFFILKFSIFVSDVGSWSDRLATSSRSISFNQRARRGKNGGAVEDRWSGCNQPKALLRIQAPHPLSSNNR